MADIDRRSLIGAGFALATTPSFASDRKVSFRVPDGATECHHHIYDPRFPYMPDSVLKPPFASVGDYRKLQKNCAPAVM